MNFEENYIALRDKEGRILSPAEIKILPDLPKNHRLYHEWKPRIESLRRLKPYLQERKFKKAIEIGCGNGWFSNWLSNEVDEVIGVDINNLELDLAVRIFPKSNLKFVKTEDLITLIKRERPDVLFFNSSLQYFNPRSKILLMLKEHMRPGTEIHFLDSKIHSTRKRALKASQGSRKYYAKQGFPEMYFHYFHYHLDLLPYVEWLYRPTKRIVNIGHLDASKRQYPWGRIRV